MKDDDSRQDDPRGVQEPRPLKDDQAWPDARNADTPARARTAEPREEGDGQLHEPGYGHGV